MGLTTRAAWIAAATLVLLGFVTDADAERRRFDFYDPKGVNAFSLSIESPLEPIVGYATDVGGWVVIDPEERKVYAELNVPATSVSFTHPTMTEKAHGENWLNAEKHGQITFKAKQVVRFEERSEGSWAVRVVGDFILRGTPREVTVDATLRVVPDGFDKRTNGRVKGDLLLLKTEFVIKRSDYQLGPIPHPLVADEVTVRAAVVGHFVAM